MGDIHIRQVDHGGVSYVTPIVACIPVNPNLYDPPRRKEWELRVAGKPPLVVDPGGVVEHCQACGVEVHVSPDQQAVVARAIALGVNAVIGCFLCCVEFSEALEANAVHVQHMDPARAFRVP